MNAEERLFHDVLDGYDTVYQSTRPVKHHGEPVSVKFGIALININAFDEDSGVGEFLCWDRYSWNDTRLTWDPAHYDGITTLRIPAHMIWKPDITTYNSLWSREVDHIMDTMAVAYSDGTVLHIPQHIRKMRCTEQLNAVSDDEFECKIKIGSWTYDGYMLDLDFYSGLEKIDITDFMGDASHITNNVAVKNIKYYPGIKEPYPDITYTLKFTDDEVEKK